MAQFGFTFDPVKCVGCHACTIACKAENNPPERVRYRRVIYRETGTFAAGTVAREATSMACYHCANPACVTACPTGAHAKETALGLVRIDPTLCIGCRRCQAACPYGAPQFNLETRKMEKCTACWHRIVDASSGTPALRPNVRPACVASCPSTAIGFAEKTTWGGGTATGAFYDRSKTNPSVDFE